MKLLAIDPGTNVTGLALFQDGILVDSVSIKAPAGDRLKRISYLLDGLAMFCYNRKPNQVVIEDPILRGAGNGAMEKWKGSIEACCQILVGWMHGGFDISDNLFYLSPTYVKRHLGSGDLSKHEMAVSALSLAKDDMERTIIQRCIDEKDYDATDAICIGLTFLGRNNIGV